MTDIELAGAGACRTSLFGTYQLFGCEPTPRAIAAQFAHHNSSVFRCAAACRVSALCDAFQVDGCLSDGTSAEHCRGKCFIFRRGSQPLVALHNPANPLQRCYLIKRSREGVSHGTTGQLAKERGMCSGRPRAEDPAAFFQRLAPRVHHVERQGFNLSCVVITTVTVGLHFHY